MSSLDQAGKLRLLSLSDLDKRTTVFREVSELIDRVERELGGPTRLTSAKRQIIEAGALASAMRRDLGVRWLNGESVNPADFATLCNAERRKYELVGALEFAADADLADAEESGEAERERQSWRPLRAA